MDPDKLSAILDVFAECKRVAEKPERERIDQMAIGLISQDCRPLVMADNLKYWLDLHAA